MKLEFPSLFTRQATRNGYFVVLDLLEHNMNSSHKDIYWHWKEHMILTPIQSLLALTHYCCIIGREITNASIRGREITNASIRTSFSVFGLIRRQIESMFIRTDEHDERSTTDAVVYNTCIFTQHFQICRSMYDLKVVSYLLFKPHLCDMVKFLTKGGWFQRVFVHSPPMILTDTIQLKIDVTRNPRSYIMHSFSDTVIYICIDIVNKIYIYIYLKFTVPK